MSKQALPFSAATKQSVRFYFAPLAILLMGLFLYNVLTLRPPLSPAQIVVYALLTTLWIHEYAMLFIRTTQVFSGVVPSFLF